MKKETPDSPMSSRSLSERDDSDAGSRSNEQIADQTSPHEEKIPDMPEQDDAEESLIEILPEIPGFAYIDESIVPKAG